MSDFEFASPLKVYKSASIQHGAARYRFDRRGGGKEEMQKIGSPINDRIKQRKSCEHSEKNRNHQRRLPRRKWHKHRHPNKK